MSREYKLNYTASEINEKLSKVDAPVSWYELKDRPFGEEKTSFIPSTTFETTLFEDTSANSYELGAEDDDRFMLYADPTMCDEMIAPFTVVFDNVVYTNITPVEVDSYVQYAGNVGLLSEMEVEGEDTGEPFVIWCSPLGVYIVCATEGTHTIEAYHEAIKTLDPKYLPSTSDVEVLEFLKELDTLMIVADDDDSILTDEDGNIIIW